MFLFLRFHVANRLKKVFYMCGQSAQNLDRHTTQIKTKQSLGNYQQINMGNNW